MSKYAQSNLTLDEKIIAKASFSMLGTICWFIFTLFFSLMGILVIIYPSNDKSYILGIIFIVIGFIPFIYSFMTTKSSELVITNKRIIGKRGFLGIHAIDLRLDKVDALNVSSSFIGRIFNYNKIVISVSGATSQSFNGIKNANQLKQIINDTINKF